MATVDLPEYKVEADRDAKDKKSIRDLADSVWKTIGKSLGIYAMAKGLIGTKGMVDEGFDPYQADLHQLVLEAFGAESMLLDLVLEKETLLRDGFQDLSNKLWAENYNYITKTQAEAQGKIDEIIAKSRSSDRLSQMGDVNSEIGRGVRQAITSTPEGRQFLGAVKGLGESNTLAAWQASGSPKTFDEWKRDREPAAARGGDFDDAPVVDEPVDIDPQLARFLEGEGEVAKLHQAMLESPSGVAQGTEGYQLGQEHPTGGIITGFNPNGSPILSGMATPDTLNALRDYVAGEGPIAEYLAQQEIDEDGQTYGEPGVAGTAPNRPWNRTQDPQFFAQQGGGGSPYFGASPFGNLGGRILPGLESAAMTQPFRPLLASLNQQALYPGVSPITQSLFQGALQELPLGGALTPGQQRDIEQQALQLAERQGNLRSRATDFAVLFDTDQAKQVRQRERQSYAAGVNEMAQREQERNRQFGINVEGATQRALGQDREFGLGVGNLLGGLNLQGQELAQRGGIASAELGQMAQRIEQEKVRQARAHLLNSISPFHQAAQAVNPMQILNIPGTTGLDYGQNQMNLGYNMLNQARPTLFQPFDPYGFLEHNLQQQQQAAETDYANQASWFDSLVGYGKGLWDKYSGDIWPKQRPRLDDPNSIQQAGSTDKEWENVASAPPVDWV